jgi:hypothetical protein
LSHFYERMYVPTIRAAHGEGALYMGFAHMMRRIDEGCSELVSVLQDGHPVGGSIVVYEHGQARLFSMGILDANQSYLQQRVGTAIRLFSFRHLAKRGYCRVNLGRSRPFFKDGPLQYKKSLGAQLTASTREGVALAPLRASPGVDEFLTANPFIGTDGRKLHGYAFRARSASDPELPGLYSFPGLASFSSLPLPLERPAHRALAWRAAHP